MPFRKRPRHSCVAIDLMPAAPPSNPPWREIAGPSPLARRRGRRSVRILRARVRSIPPAAFTALDDAGRAMPEETRRPLHATTRMVHCFAIAHLLGRARRGRFRRSRHARAADPASRRQARRLFLVVRRRRPARARQARLWPRLRAARGLERQMRGPSRRGPAARRHFRGDGEAVLGAGPGRQRRGIPRGLDPVQRTIAARTPTCI